MDETLQTASGTEDVQQLLLDGADYPRSWREMFDSLVKSSTFADEHWGRQPFVHTFEKQAQNNESEIVIKEKLKYILPIIKESIIEYKMILNKLEAL